MKIPTAEEFYQHAIDNKSIGDDITDLLNAYAKLHVEAALKAAHRNFQAPEEDLEFTLGSYPLTNIK